MAQHTGVVLCLVKLGRDADRRLFYGSLTLGWYDSDPVPADLAFARLVVGEAADLMELDTPTGPGLLQRTTETVPPERPACRGPLRESYRGGVGTVKATRPRDASRSAAGMAPSTPQRDPRSIRCPRA